MCNDLIVFTAVSSNSDYLSLKLEVTEMFKREFYCFFYLKLNIGTTLYSCAALRMCCLQ